MSLEELARAKAAIARLRLPLFDVPTRRFAPDRRGARADMRATLRAALRSGGLIELKRKSRRRRPPPLVVLCDISGSMSRYSRLFLHFMHSITNDRDRVYTFVFGTRLTNITRYLRYDRRSGARTGSPGVADWSGRHPHRPLGARVQPVLVASRLRAGGGGADDHRRARPRCRHRAGA
jgi:uncharacterized protein with von Willebrand factor type A (vWA) domain